jgi:hypothetical protein
MIELFLCFSGAEIASNNVLPVCTVAYSERGTINSFTLQSFKSILPSIGVPNKGRKPML